MTWLHPAVASLWPGSCTLPSTPRRSWPINRALGTWCRVIKVFRAAPESCGTDPAGLCGVLCARGCQPGPHIWWWALGESRGGRKESREQILLCIPSTFLSGRIQCFTGQICLDHSSTQEWGSSRIKTPCLVSAGVVTVSSWICIGFVILMYAVLALCMGTLSSAHPVPLPTACCFQQEPRRSQDS